MKFANRLCCENTSDSYKSGGDITVEKNKSIKKTEKKAEGCEVFKQWKRND